MNIKNIDETKYKALVLEQRGMNLAFYRKGGQNQMEPQKGTPAKEEELLFQV